jgi:hypothetical protein
MLPLSSPRYPTPRPRPWLRPTLWALLAAGLLALLLAGPGSCLPANEPPPPLTAAQRQAQAKAQAAAFAQLNLNPQQLTTTFTHIQQQWVRLQQAAQTVGTLGQGVQLSLSRSLNKQWLVQAHEAVYLEKPEGVAFFKTVDGQLFKPNGQVAATFSAPFAQYNEQTQLLRLRSSVAASNNEAANGPKNTPPQKAHFVVYTSQ